MPNELDQIREVMRTDPGRYWGDPQMQTRLGELASAGAAPAVRVSEGDTDGGTLPEVLDPEMTRAGLERFGSTGKALVEEWAQFGDPEFRNAVKATQSVALNIMSGMGDREMKVFMGVFDTLPDQAITAVYRELSIGRPNFIPDATDAEVKLFASTEEGGELVREWGSSAPRRVAIIRARFARVVAQMGAAGADFRAWWNSLPASQAKSILWTISR